MARFCLLEMLNVLFSPRLWTRLDASGCTLPHSYDKNLLLSHTLEKSSPHPTHLRSGVAKPLPTSLAGSLPVTLVNWPRGSNLPDEHSTTGILPQKHCSGTLGLVSFVSSFMLDTQRNSAQVLTYGHVSLLWSAQLLTE